MRLAELPRTASRRQKRREKESDPGRGIDRTFNKPVKRAIKPVYLKPEQVKTPQVPRPKNAFLEEKKEIAELPDQETLLNTCLRPLRQVEMVLLHRDWEDNPEVRPTIIHDIDEQGVLYLAQTSPPILRSDSGRFAELSFLARYYDVPGGRWLRVGYRTKIKQVILNYRLTKSVIENVFTVDSPKELNPVTLRLSYRIALPEDIEATLVLWPDGLELGIMDLSAGGIQFYHDSHMSFSKGSRLKLAILSGSGKLILKARVIRTSEIFDRTGQPLGLTSVSFLDLTPDIRNQYLMYLTEIYRHMLAQRSGLASD